MIEDNRKLWILVALSVKTTDEKLADEYANWLVNEMKSDEEVDFAINWLEGNNELSKKEKKELEEIYK